MRAPILLLALAGASPLAAQVTGDVPVIRPDAVVNLATDDGARLVAGSWRYSDTRIVEVAHRSAGPDRRASGPPNRAYDVSPQAGAAEFDDSAWETIPASSLDQRRSAGRLSFSWYRLHFTVPERIGNLDAAGAAIVFEIVVDDYAEVWVDGQLPLVLGQSGGPLAHGWNAPNRVVLTRSAKPGQHITVAVFAANGPLSSPPGNFIWVRSATLEFYRPGRVGSFPATPAMVERRDPALDAIVPQGAMIEKLAGGFLFTEGPIWVRDGGYLLFSDPNANIIYRWNTDGQVSVFRTKSGYTGADIGEYGQPGSNGLTLDKEGRLVINEHGNHRVTRLEKNGVITVLADQYQGKRLNSPNDLVYRSDGTLYFTDPPFGLPKYHDDPRRELAFSGVFMLKDNKLTLLVDSLQGPNGLAFSPDEKFLYVTNWDVQRKWVMRYPVRADGSVGRGTLFFDMGGAPGEEALDGIKVDTRGNLYVSGPGGLWILSAEGKHLGTVQGPELAANFAWGDDDGRTLYLTARSGVYRMRLNIPGIRP